MAAMFALLWASCSSSGGGRVSSSSVGRAHVCFELREGDPIQDGLDFYGLFLVDGHFVPGARNISFDSGKSRLDVELQDGVDGESWVDALPDEVLAQPVLTRWSVSEVGCLS
jgi:hypothetical protein